jgi:hypothetical protein
MLGKPSANGLTIKLIHRDSPASPLYPGNITSIERIQRLVNQSKARAAAAAGYLSTHPNEAIGAPIAVQAKAIYIWRELALAPSMQLSLLGHSRHTTCTWTLEAPSHGHSVRTVHSLVIVASLVVIPLSPTGFPQLIGLFPCNLHPLCIPHQCTGDSCFYQSRYLDGAYTTGILASEAFTFLSTSGRHQTTPNIVFGYSIDSADMNHGGNDNQVNGIFGLGWGIRSFVNQIEDLSHGTFSYCLKFNDGHAMDTYIRFGGDISQPTTVLQTTKLVQFKSSQPYFIELLGISINGTRLDINPELFSLQFDGSEGCAIDSGTTFTTIIKSAYDVVIRKLQIYFLGFPYQQTNQKFIYDITRKQLQFAPEDCAQNA